MAKNRVGSLSFQMVLDTGPMKAGLERGKKMMNDFRRRERVRERMAQRGRTTGFGGTFRARRGGRLGSMMASARGALASAAGRHPVLAAAAAIGGAAALIAKAGAAMLEATEKLSQVAIQARQARTSPAALLAQQRAAADPFGRGVAFQRSRINSGVMGRNLRAAYELTDARNQRQDATDEFLQSSGLQSWWANVNRGTAAILRSNTNMVNRFIRATPTAVDEDRANRMPRLSNQEVASSRFLSASAGGGTGGGGAGVIRSGDRSLYDFFVRRQDQDAREQVELARAALEKHGETTDLLREIANDVRARETAANQAVADFAGVN